MGSVASDPDSVFAAKGAPTMQLFSQKIRSLWLALAITVMRYDCQTCQAAGKSFCHQVLAGH